MGNSETKNYKYFLSNNVYIYPSANAKDGGSENSEKNLALITDKFTTNNFVIRNKDVSIEQDTSLSLTVNERGNLVIRAGACVINGYYIKVEETEIPVEDCLPIMDAKSVAPVDTTFNVFIQLHMDGSGLVRGDSGLQCFGISYKFEFINSIDETNNPKLLLGTIGFTNREFADSSKVIFDINSIEIPKNKFTYINSECVRDADGKTIYDYLNDAIYNLSTLRYSYNQAGKRINSRLYLGTNAIYYKPSEEDEEIELLTELKRSLPNQTTEIGKNSSINGVSTKPTFTYNGSLNENARADHDHDTRYLLNNDAYIGEQSVSNLKVINSLTINKVSFENKSIKLDTDTGFLSFNTGLFTESLYVFGSNKDTAKFKVEKYNPMFDTVKVSIVGELEATGTIKAEKVYNAVWNDYAELYKKADPSKEYEPGTVICKVKGKDVYDTASYVNGSLVVGVVSDSYGHLLGGDKDKSLEENLKEYIPVGISGRVYVKVPRGIIIEEGYLMYPTGTDGRATGRDPALNLHDRGTIIGKALESTDGSKDKILMQIMLG